MSGEEESKVKQSIAVLLSYCDHRRSSWHLSQGLLACLLDNASLSFDQGLKSAGMVCQHILEIAIRHTGIFNLVAQKYM